MKKRRSIANFVLHGRSEGQTSTVYRTAVESGTLTLTVRAIDNGPGKLRHIATAKLSALDCRVGEVGIMAAVIARHRTAITTCSDALRLATEDWKVTR